MMTKYLKNTEGYIFLKMLNDDEALQLTKYKNITGITILSRGLIAGDFIEIGKDEFAVAYSEVKRKLINHDLLQDEEEEMYLSEVFNDWAESYYLERMATDVVKENALAAMKYYAPTTLGNMTSNAFKKHMKAWCQLMGYSFDDRIMKLIGGKTTEHIRITAKQNTI